VMLTPVKVATPLTADAVIAPVNVQEEEIVTESEEAVTTLPAESSIVTAKVARVVPAVVELGGAVVKTTLDSPAGLIATGDELPDARPLEAAESVNEPFPTRPLSVTPVKVATPDEALTEVVPPRVPELLTLSETLAELDVTVLP
jgi:hypothetical protein